MIRLGVTRGPFARCGIADFARYQCAALPADFEVRWIELPARGGGQAFREAAHGARGLDLVHVHYEHALFEPVKPWRNRLAGFLEALDVPAVVTLHGELPALRPRWTGAATYRWRDALRDAAYLPFFGGWERHVHGGAAHWIAPAEGQLRRVAAALDASRVSLGRHPVPHASRLWRRADDAVTLVVPGFTKRHKGYARLLALLPSRPAWRLVLAGGPQDDDDRAFLADLHADAQALGIAARLTVTGYLDSAALEEALARATLVVLPYERGGSSGALAWAIAVGAPVATSDLPGFRELRAIGAGLELLPPGEVGPLLEALCGDAGRLEALAERNRGYAASHSFAVATRATADLFRRIVGRA